MIKKNACASIWEVIPLFAFRKMFPSLDFSNEVNLSDVKQTGSHEACMRFDIYSEKAKIAIEISRIGAHSSKETLDNDLIKQQFSADSGITLFHIRESLCDHNNFENVFAFNVGENTGDIAYPISALCSAIENVAYAIEKKLGIKRVANVNYGTDLDSIRRLYRRITNKTYDGSDVTNSDYKLAKKLGLTTQEFVSFCNERRLSSSEAFILLQNNQSKYVKDGNFLAKNADEAKVANKVIAEKDRLLEEKEAELQLLYQLYKKATGREIHISDMVKNSILQDNKKERN